MSRTESRQVMAQYKIRDGIFSKPMEYETFGDRLLFRKEEGASGEILYDDILSIKMEFAPGRNNMKRYIMTLESKNRTPLIIDTAGVGLDPFKLSNNEFNVFVRTLAA